MLKYSYIIYKIQSWATNGIPIASTILTLAVVHFFQLITVIMFIDLIIFPLKWLHHFNIIYIYLFSQLYFILHYLLLYNKKKWETYNKIYENETDTERKRGNLIVISYLIGSILMFFISLPILFSFGK